MVIEESWTPRTGSPHAWSEERLRIAKLAAGLGIHEYHPRSGELLWDQRVRELWGIGPHEPVTYELFMSGLHPDDRAPTQAVVEAALDPAGDGVYHAQYRVISRADGRTRWLDATGQVSFEDGHAERLVGAVMDITPLKRVEDELRESEGRFRSMADGTPVMIWVTDAAGRVEYVNRAYEAFFGTSLAQIRSGGWQMLVHPEDHATYVTPFLTALRERIPFHAQGRVAQANGTWRWIESFGAPRFGGDGTYLGMAGSSPDITPLKQTEARLRDALAAKDEFLGFISHELRTPMTVILGMSKLLAAATLSEPQRQELVADIYASAQELDAMIETLLVLARFEHAPGQLEGEPVLLSRLVAGVLERQRAVDAAHPYRLDVRCPDAIAECDPAWTERVLANLLGNAAKYSPAGAAITAVVDAADGEVRVLVLDEGRGIAPDEVEQLFEPFYRSPSTREAVPGVGLGLTVCRRIIEGMGGRAWASPRPSGGAEFGFSLPSAREDGDAGGSIETG
jgi:PAS domain S-box-containing protein